jgi:hypothetical protein
MASTFEGAVESWVDDKIPSNRVSRSTPPLPRSIVGGLGRWLLTRASFVYRQKAESADSKFRPEQMRRFFELSADDWHGLDMSAMLPRMRRSSIFRQGYDNVDQTSVKF